LDLKIFGWDAFFEKHFEPYAAKGYSAGRVSLEHRKRYRLYTSEGELWGDIRGKFFHTAESREDLPVVGDWVVIRMLPNEKKAVIHALLPRKSKFSRKVKGDRLEEQLVAANIDTVFLVSGLDNEFNPRRIERYLTLTSESGARAVIVLNKADLCPDIDEKIKQADMVAQGNPVIVISALQKDDLKKLDPFIKKGETIALLGSSGVGKSTIINQLLGEKVQKVHDDVPNFRGLHVTTHRQLFLLPSGGLIIDTPGMREIQLWVGEAGLEEAFEDITRLAEKCYFRDCQHQNEPGCAVREALESGELSYDRYQSYLKLKREIEETAWQLTVKKKPDKKKKKKSEQKESKYKNRW